MIDLLAYKISHYELGAMKQKSSHRIGATVLLFHSLQKLVLRKYYLKVYYHTKYQDPILSDASVSSAFEIRMVITLVLLAVKN